MSKRLARRIFIVLIVYIGICGLLYLCQEKLIYFPEKLAKDYQFNFNQSFEELNIEAERGKFINGLLFKAQKSEGLIFYLHGNAGSLRSWGEVANTYTSLNYDVFIFDYRGYGKSDGEITSPEQLFEDNQIVYNALKKRYPEKDIILLGYSIGSGLAAKLASENNSKALILQAPYSSLTDIMKDRFPLIPTFILKYKFYTNQYLNQCKMPVIIFHGRQDEVINYSSSLKLQKEFKPSDTLITLENQGHNGITDNSYYKIELAKTLRK